MDNRICEILDGAPEDDPKTWRSKNPKSNSKRRFSEEQIKSLESIFSKDPKLEARKKAEVAGQLGLEPRQVGIWFQNKRARWKSRQLETDLSVLRSDYDALSSRFDSLANDKRSLLLQLRKLKQAVGTRKGGASDCKGNEHGKQSEAMQELEGSESGNILAPWIPGGWDEAWGGFESEALFDPSAAVPCDWWDSPFAAHT